MTNNEIKPSISPFAWIILTTFSMVGVMLLLNRKLDFGLQLGGIFFLSLVVGILYAIDYTHLYLTVNDHTIKLKGFFGKRKLNLGRDDVEGYEIHQKVGQINGLHEEFQLVTKTYGRILLPRAAYEDVYMDIRLLCESNFKFLGYNSLNYGKVLGKIIPLMGLISGILAGLVGLMKIL